MHAAIVQAISIRAYEVYTRPYELNIIGIRSDSTVSNRFDDEFHIFFKNNLGSWIHYLFAATTDPGTYWLQSPMHPQGTAILSQGQYRGAYQIGLHKGKYYALVQRKPVTVLRDYDRNAVLDFMNGKPDTGMFGINIHRASVNGTTKEIDKYSAGCQVFANVNDFNLFMQLCEKHRQLYGNSFTYTLIDKRAIARSEKKKLVVSLAGIGVGIGAGLIVYQIVKP
ncbi:MAG: hypothetical protein J0I32_05900 [Sphingobacteriales bacterium]|nr:hypothetical protein [Sphingobacteriales bacterium]OJW03898.1 MAG: hypothetical protein BGO52_17260 [Sphingobacteriales bacterium 44-61]